MTGRQNIEAVWKLADVTDRMEGMTAYRRYHSLLSYFADYYGCAFNNTVAAFVSLSPNNSWFNNLRSLASVLDGIRKDVPMQEIITSTYHACRDRAYLYATGANDFGISTKGPKIRAFYENILDPTAWKPVTVDGHMTAIWLGKKMTMVEAARARVKYSDVARGLRTFSRDHGLIPNQLQATLWFTWKRINNIVYDPQMNLFRTDDNWAIVHRPQDVKPFTQRDGRPIITGLRTVAIEQLSLYN